MTEKEFITKNSNLNPKSIHETLSLFSTGATIPFIARYRKERTGNLDEVDIALILQLAGKYKEIKKRKEYIKKVISEKKALSKEFQSKIDNCWDLNKLEDYYLPYKNKRITKGKKAKNAGLLPLAKLIMKQDNVDPHSSATRFLSKEYNTTELAIQGAQYIIADWINENIVVREKFRNSFIQHGQITTKEITSKKKISDQQKKEKQKFKDILNYSQRIQNCPSYRLLAILRAESKGYIRLKIEPNIIFSLDWLERFFCKNNNYNSLLVKQAIKDTYKRLLQPVLETETKQYYKNIADDKSIETFKINLEKLLLTAPLGAKSVLALDPGYRTGCKLACLDKSGKLIHDSTIFPHPPQSNIAKSTSEIKSLLKKYNISAIAIGDGTAGRETEKWIKSIGLNERIQIHSVREDGASIYSASKIAREEFPEKDITVRGAVSIGRRLLDPLAELVKIDPKSLGIGQYQHDVNQIKLKSTLDLVVESCVNKVGVNINTASKYLLSYVSGIGINLAESIVNYREKNGLIQSREELKKIPKMGKKSFELAAGFLKIAISKNPLDNSSIHPESYKIVQEIATDLKVDIKHIISNNKILDNVKLENYINKIDGYSLADIIKELKKPGIDPRKKNNSFSFTEGIASINDIMVGQKLNGIITNVTEFGCFVNIGIKENGLIHKTEFSHTYVENPSDFVSIDQQVVAKVIQLDNERKRISLTLKE
mgnify:CR=1 FL=1